MQRQVKAQQSIEFLACLYECTGRAVALLHASAMPAALEGAAAAALGKC